jgi:hypothetical protein
MKQVFKIALGVALFAASFITLSSFLNKKTSTTVDSYQIVLVSKTTSGSVTEWSWSVSNPNPGNGSNGTLQDISHWSMPLNAAAEAALISAFYSYDGVTWYSTSPTVDRDPSIKQCTSTDVLKFDIGTSGAAPTYYRACYNGDFAINPFATSWVKTGGGQQGCNLNFFSGLGVANN